MIAVIDMLDDQFESVFDPRMAASSMGNALFALSLHTQPSVDDIGSSEARTIDWICDISEDLATAFRAID
jgi:hypothetical protein